MASLLNNPIRKALASPFVAGLLISSCVFALCANDAMAQRGGGGGGRGGGAGASRGGGGGGGGSHGGRQAKSSVSSGNRASSGGGGNRGGNTSSANRSGNTANRSGNTTNRTNNSSRNTNIGSNNNVNVNRGDVNIDVDGGYGNGCCRARYPIAAGVAIGAVAGMTAAAVGSYYYGLPSGCGMVTLSGIGYYQCGSAYYQQSMNGDQVVYVSVNP